MSSPHPSPSPDHPDLNLTTASDRPSVWPLPPEDEAKIWGNVSDPPRYGYRPSSLGNCFRALVASRLGVPGDPLSDDTLLVCNEGHIHEPHVAAWVEKKFGGIIQRSPKLYLVIGKLAVCAGEGDAILWDKGRRRARGVEIKAQAPTVFERSQSGEISDGYLWQMSLYWAAIELRIGFPLHSFLFTFKNRLNGKIETNELMAPPYTKAQVMGRIATVEMAARKLQQERLTWASGGYHGDCPPWPTCDKADYFCDWWRIHDIAKSGTEVDETLAPLLTQSVHLKKEIDKLKQQRADVTDMIDAAMGRDRMKVQAGGCTVFRSPEKFRTETDVDMFLAENPNMMPLLMKYQQTRIETDLNKFLIENPEVLSIINNYQRQVPCKRGYIQVNPPRK